MKALRITLLLLCLCGTLVFMGANWLWKSNPLESVDEAAFTGDVLFALNRDRALARLPYLQTDNQLQQWLRHEIEHAEDAESIASQALIDKLQSEMPSVAGASIYIVYGKKTEELKEKLGEWGGTLDDELIHFAARLFQSPGYRGMGCVALMAEKLPLFTPALLNKKADTFYNYCRVCREPHIGKIRAASRSIVLECPQCNEKYDLLAVNMKGKYRRVNDYLSGFVPSADLPRTKTRKEELFAIWNAVLDHCRYQTDFSGIHGQRDSWQTSMETHRYANGDCEDTSILLADWLISEGFDARVALGRTDRLEGHAWCVVSLEDEEYILETTDVTPDPRMPPLVGNLGRHYYPEFMFDEESIYFLKRRGWTSDYWTEMTWLEVSDPEGDDPAGLNTVASSKQR